MSLNFLSCEVWDMRMGHIPCRRLKLPPLTIDFNDMQQDAACMVCPKAKQQRLSFPLSTISTSCAFELIHVDTWGPYHTKTHNGHRYFLIIVDDFTRATWTHLMVTKDEAVELIKSFVYMAHTQFAATVKVIKSKNALKLSTSNTALDCLLPLELYIKLVVFRRHNKMV